MPQLNNIRYGQANKGFEPGSSWGALKQFTDATKKNLNRQLINFNNNTLSPADELSILATHDRLVKNKARALGKIKLPAIGHSVLAFKRADIITRLNKLPSLQKQLAYADRELKNIARAILRKEKQGLNVEKDQSDFESMLTLIKSINFKRK